MKVDAKPTIHLIGEIHETPDDNYNQRGYDRLASSLVEHNISPLLEDLQDMREMELCCLGISGKSTFLSFAEKVNGQDLAPGYARQAALSKAKGDRKQLRELKNESIAQNIRLTQVASNTDVVAVLGANRVPGSANKLREEGLNVRTYRLLPNLENSSRDSISNVKQANNDFFKIAKDTEGFDFSRHGLLIDLEKQLQNK